MLCTVSAAVGCGGWAGARVPARFQHSFLKAASRRPPSKRLSTSWDQSRSRLGGIDALLLAGTWTETPPSIWQNLTSRKAVSFSNAVQNMISQSTDIVIGLVVRWDEDDSLVWTFWSVGPSKSFPKSASPVFIAPFTRIRRDFLANNSGHEDHHLGLSFDLGLHAEEVLLLSWENLLNVVRQSKGKPEYYPKRVDLVLSKSPCHGDSGSSPLTIRFSNGVLGFNHTGCAYKLRDFMKSQPVKKWSLRYFDLAGSKSSSSDTDRHLAGQNYWRTRSTINPLHQTDIQNWRNFIPRKQQGSKVPHRIQKGSADRVIEKRHQTRLNELEFIHRGMRSMSVAQAQHGIAILEQLVNVDVERILRQESIVDLS